MMNGLGNKNISFDELFEFGKDVLSEKAVCPKCGNKKLKMADYYANESNDPWRDRTYIAGLEPYVYFEVSCDCGFKNRFNTSWCRKGLD